MSNGAVAARCDTQHGTALTGTHAQPAGLTVLTHDGWAGIALDELLGEYVYMTAAKTAAQRQAERKARQIAAGLVQWKRWVHPDDVQALAEYADKLQRKRERKQLAPATKMC